MYHVNCIHIPVMYSIRKILYNVLKFYFRLVLMNITGPNVQTLDKVLIVTEISSGGESNFFNLSFRFSK